MTLPLLQSTEDRLWRPRACPREKPGGGRPWEAWGWARGPRESRSTRGPRSWCDDASVVHGVLPRVPPPVASGWPQMPTRRTVWTTFLNVELIKLAKDVLKTTKIANRRISCFDLINQSELRICLLYRFAKNPNLTCVMKLWRGQI